MVIEVIDFHHFKVRSIIIFYIFSISIKIGKKYDPPDLPDRFLNPQNRAKQFSSVTSKPSKSVTTCYSIGLILILALFIAIASVVNRGVYINIFTLGPAFLLASHRSLFWTPNKVDLLRRLKSEGRSDRECAEMLNVMGEDGEPSADAIKMQRCRSKIPAKRSQSTTRSIEAKATEAEPIIEDFIGADIAQRIARLKGEILVKDESAPPPSTEALQRYIGGYEACIVFIKERCDFEPFDYQDDMVKLIHENPKTCLPLGRQLGKDTVTGLYSLWHVITHANSRIVVVSPAQRVSDLWLSTMMAFVVANKELYNCVTDFSASHIKFSNNSEIWSLPSGQQGSATIRGFSKVNILIFNEAAWVDDSTYQACQPFLAVSKDSKLILISTPFGKQNMLWRSYNSPLFKTMNLPSSKNPLITAEFLHSELEMMGTMAFNSEYLAIFQDLQDSFFPQALIQKCIEPLPLSDYPIEEHIPYYMGLDFGAVHAQTVTTIIGVHKDKEDDKAKPKLVVHYIKAFDTSVPINEQLDQITWLYNRFKPKKLYADASGRSEIDYLKSKHVRVTPFNFTVDSKVEMFGFLKIIMEEGRLAIPDSERRLIHQLGSFTYKITESQHMKLHGAKGVHDDYVDSIGMAAWAAGKIKARREFRVW